MNSISVSMINNLIISKAINLYDVHCEITPNTILGSSLTLVSFMSLISDITYYLDIKIELDLMEALRIEPINIISKTLIKLIHE